MKLLIIQARLGSSRLPGKVLKKIENKTLLEWQIERIKPSKNIDQIMVATTTNPEDITIKKLCSSIGIPCFCGDENDVLDRYFQAITSSNRKFDTVVRITSDCPLHSYQVIDECIQEFELRKVDYFSNSNHAPNYLEDGYDTEVFTFDALKKAWESAKLQSEREHVTPYIKNSGLFQCAWKKTNSEYKFKFSVDTEADLLVVKRIFKELKDISHFSINDVVNLLKQKPEILELNKTSIINSGYKKSLEQDRIIK